MTDPDLGFEDFVAARWSALYRTAYLLCGTRPEAEDLLQSALATTCVRWSHIRDKGAADAYVRRTMLNLAQRHWRRRRREVATANLPDSGHDHLGARADHVALWTEVRRLPPRMRAVLVLRYFEDLSVAQTAAALGCSEGTVKSQTHHAVRQLRSALPALELSEDPA